MIRQLASRTGITITHSRAMSHHSRANPSRSSASRRLPAGHEKPGHSRSATLRPRSSGCIVVRHALTCPGPRSMSPCARPADRPAGPQCVTRRRRPAVRHVGNSTDAPFALVRGLGGRVQTVGVTDSSPLVAAIVLVGGRSARMGRAKARLDWHGSTLLQRTVGIAIRAVDGPVLVVAGAGAAAALAATARAGRGRPGGRPRSAPGHRHRSRRGGPPRDGGRRLRRRPALPAPRVRPPRGARAARGCGTRRRAPGGPGPCPAARRRLPHRPRPARRRARRRRHVRAQALFEGATCSFWTRPRCWPTPRWPRPIPGWSRWSTSTPPARPGGSGASGADGGGPVLRDARHRGRTGSADGARGHAARRRERGGPGSRRVGGRRGRGGVPDREQAGRRRTTTDPELPLLPGDSVAFLPGGRALLS